MVRALALSCLLFPCVILAAPELKLQLDEGAELAFHVEKGREFSMRRGDNSRETKNTSSVDYAIKVKSVGENGRMAVGRSPNPTSPWSVKSWINSHFRCPI